MKSVLRIITGLFVCLFLMLPIFAAESVSPFNDPHYSQQWALEAINWLPVWQQGLTGKGVKIGIIDTGANSLHEDLQGASLQGSNFIGAQSETFADDKIGHGTFVAGVIAAQPNNGKGIVGIAPDVELYIYRGYDGKLPPILAAIDQAIADGCQIINFSLGATEAALKESYSVLQQGIQKVQDAGILAVAAVGNGRPNATVTLYPAGFAGVLGVGSVNENLERSSFSQTNLSVFVVAPGEKLVSVSHNAADKYVTGGGTSYAAPVVTALAALALDYDPTLTPAEIMEMMRLTATDLGEPGYDIFYGYGLVNGAALIEGLKSHFPVRYQLMGGAFAEEVPLFYSVLEGVQQLPEPVCEGHNFAGWYADEDRTVAIAQIAAGTTDAQVLYAKWKSNGQGLCSDAAGDGDHACDICGADGASVCTDDDKDHFCDECSVILSEHQDHDTDHICDWCGETLSECMDSEDADTLCDLCGKDLFRFTATEDAVNVLDAPEDLMVLIALYEDCGKLISVEVICPSAEQRKEFIIPVSPSVPACIYFLNKDTCIPYLQHFSSQMLGQ